MNLKQWTRWTFAFAASTVSGLFLLPYIRNQFDSKNTFTSEMESWIRLPLVLFSCVIVAQVLFNALDPRIRHLRYICVQPPIWMAVTAGAVCLAILDLSHNIRGSEYRATWTDWLICATAIAVVWNLNRKFEQQDVSRAVRSRIGDAQADQIVHFKEWLKVESPGQFDLLSHKVIANRVKQHLLDGARSIGIIGDFGSGKSSIVRWLTDSFPADNGVLVDLVQSLKSTIDHINVRLGQILNAEPIRYANRSASESPKNEPVFLFSEHECWCFETSTSAIQGMLVDGIRKVTEHIDTFHVRSLPESYRQSISAGGPWFDNFAKIFLGQTDAIEQFRSLSALLANMNANLVFVVEDLDRADSKKFEIQEVLAFLGQLREFTGLRFILTGGTESVSKIDFHKLCDKFESTRDLDESHLSRAIDLLKSICLDQGTYKFAQIYCERLLFDPQRLEFSGDYTLPSVYLAMIEVLNTPRKVRAAFSSVLNTWHGLYGEVDLDHLIVLESLKSGAPEAFKFVQKNRVELNALGGSSSGGRRRSRKTHAIAAERVAILVKEWNEMPEVSSRVKRAARALVDAVTCQALAAALADSETSAEVPAPEQGVQSYRYMRTILEQATPGEWFSDREIGVDLFKWLVHDNGQLAARFFCEQKYGETFVRFWMNRRLLKCADLWPSKAKHWELSEAVFREHLRHRSVDAFIFDPLRPQSEHWLGPCRELTSQYSHGEFEHTRFLIRLVPESVQAGAASFCMLIDAFLFSRLRIGGGPPEEPYRIDSLAHTGVFLSIDNALQDLRDTERMRLFIRQGGGGCFAYCMVLLANNPIAQSPFDLRWIGQLLMNGLLTPGEEFRTAAVALLSSAGGNFEQWFGVPPDQLRSVVDRGSDPA